MNKSVISLVIVCAGASIFSALAATQESVGQEPPQLRLRVRTTNIVAGEPAAGFLQPIKCDARGNIYVRLGGSFLNSPVARIPRDGSSIRRFSLDNAPGFDRGQTFGDFAVDLRGNVYLITTRLAKREGVRREEYEQVIVAFDSDGKYTSSLKLEELFKSEHLAVFPSGEFLAYGERTKVSEGQPSSTGQPFTGIFDRQGRLIKEIALADDIEAEPEGPGTDVLRPQPAGSLDAEGSGRKDTTESSKTKLSAQDFGIALSLGKAVPADDGNVYLMRATRDPIFYAIASNGSAVRRFVVAAPEGATRPLSFHIAGGRIVVMFVETDSRGGFKTHHFVVANAESGEPLYQFLGTRELGGGFACYTPNGMVFLGADGGQLAIRETYPQ